MLSAPVAVPVPVVVEVKRGRLAETIHAELSRRVADGLGCAVIVEQDGAVVLESGYGWADRERRLPFKVSTIAQVGSLTKQFTAAAVADLSEAGKLSLSDPISKHLAEVPDRAARITIEQLLTHTSGLPESCGKDFDRVSRQQIVRDCLARVDIQAAGTFRYSNLGYSLLGAVVETVSGSPLEVYLARRFFEPLGMKRTGYSFPGVPPDEFASGYSGATRIPPISVRIGQLAGNFWNLKGNGGMQASASDMYTWHRALAGGPVVSDAVRRDLMTLHVRRDSEVGYGYGWFIRSDDEGRVVQASHTGSDGVFFAAFVWRPLDRVFYYLVSNNGEKAGAEIASMMLRACRKEAAGP